MSQLLVIDGAEYAFPDFDSLTYRESNLIKKLTGLRMGDMVEAFDKGDTDVIIALAIVAKSRAGELVSTDELYDLPIGKIEAVFQPDPVDDTEEPERVDPTPTSDDESATTQPNGNGSAVSTSTTVTT